MYGRRGSFGVRATTGRRAVLALLLGAGACGGSGSPAEPVAEVPVASVTVDPASFDLEVGDTLRLRAVALAANGAPLSGRPISWSVGDATLAQVSSTGLVTGRRAGGTWVRATVGTVYGTTVARVLDPEPLPTISGLSPASAAAGSGDFTLTVTGTGFAEGSRILWAGDPRPTTRLDGTTLRTSVRAADVAQARGVEVRVEGPSGTSGPATFTVTAAGGGSPGAASLSPSSLPAGSEAFTLTVRGSGFGPDAEVRWAGAARPTSRVSDTELRAEIGVSDVWLPGPVQVTVADGPDAPGSEPLLFTIAPSGIEAVVVTPPGLVLDPGEEARIEVVLEGADGRPVQGRHVSFTSTNGTVVAAFGDGSVKALEFGTAKIRVATSDVFTLVTVVVNPPPVDRVVVEPVAPAALVGQRVQLLARTFAAGGAEVFDREVTWSSADPSLATVDADGLVTARARGRVRVFAESEGRTGSAELEIREWPSTAEWTFDLRLEPFTALPTVGDTTWVDDGGASHTAFLVLTGATLVLDRGDGGAWRQALRLELWEGGARVGEVVREDRGTSLSGLPPGIFFSSTITPGYTFTGTLGALADLRLNQKIGTASRPDWYYVIR